MHGNEWDQEFILEQTLCNRNKRAEHVFVHIGSGQQNESPFKNTCEEEATSFAQILLAGADIMTLCTLVVFDR